MLDTQMPRNSQRDDEELTVTPEMENIWRLEAEIAELKETPKGWIYHGETHDGISLFKREV